MNDIERRLSRAVAPDLDATRLDEELGHDGIAGYVSKYSQFDLRIVRRHQLVSG